MKTTVYKGIAENVRHTLINEKSLDNAKETLLKIIKLGYNDSGHKEPEALKIFFSEREIKEIKEKKRMKHDRSSRVAGSTLFIGLGVVSSGQTGRCFKRYQSLGYVQLSL